MSETNDRPQPKTIHSLGQSPNITIDCPAVGSAMIGLGISPDTIANTTLYVDPTDHLVTNGMTYPQTIGRLRHIFSSELKDVSGPVIRLSTRVRGRERDEESMNRTLAHELEHVAQIDRRDIRVKIGHAVIWGLAATGAIAGNLADHNKLTRTGLVLLGAAIGQQIGYKIAPHEKQARVSAEQHPVTAIRRQR